MKTGQLVAINFASLPQAGLMRRARQVAAALRLGLFVCCLLDDARLPPALPGSQGRVRSIRRKLVARCNASLQKVLEEMRDEGIAAEGEVQTTSSVADAVLTLVRRRSPCLVLITRGRHSRLENATFSGSDFVVIRCCPVPVWVVNSEHRSGDKIVGAIEQSRTNGSDGNGSGSLDARILGAASRLAREFGKEHHALHTFGQAGLPRAVEPAASDPDDDMGTSRYDRRMRRVFAFGAKHGLPRERIHIHEGKLVETLEELAGPMNADLIILGASRHGRLADLFSGSAVERVVQRVKADVLILKSSGSQAAEGHRWFH
jgi:universal stress protein E